MKNAARIETIPGVTPARLAFREATSTHELVSLLRLRNRAYAESRYAVFEPAGRLGFNLDCHDLKSWHLGLFREDGVGSEPLGYLRVVENRGVADARMHQLALRHRHDFPGVQDEPANPLPVMDYWPQREALRAAYAAENGPGRRVVEASRLSLDPECRSLHMAKFLIEAALASFFFAYQIEAAFLVTSTKHRAFYERVGFRVADGTSASSVDSVKIIGVCMVATPNSVPPELAIRLRAHADEYRNRRCISTEEPAAASAVRRIA